VQEHVKSVSDFDIGVEATRWRLRDESVPSIKEATRMEKAASCVRDRLLIGVLFDLSCHVSEAQALAFEDAGPADGVVIIEHLAVRPNRDTCQEAVFYHLSRGETDHDFAT